MSLLSGTRIGSYEVLGQIGAGGMGEVYRARDTKLGRNVALKVLPTHLASSGEQLARFRREAHVLASLNHPGIAHLYGLDDSTGQVVLIMELIDGPTLAERIAQGPIPFDEASVLAIQICEALEAAHEQGVIHRDLKPANIKVRPDGTVKVLDFGLAKVLDAGDASTMEATMPGVVLGTAAYMAPEQARGMDAGTQADVWAFGCVLFEMLTGRSAFGRGTFAETIANVVSGTIDYEQLPAATPGMARRVIRRCLERDVRARLHHLGDARADLADARNAPAVPVAASAVSRRHSRVVGSAVVVASVVVTATLGWWWGQRTNSGETVTSARLSMTFAERPRIEPFGTRHLAISSDGTRVAYAANSRLWIRRLEEREARTSDGFGINPFFSPDGEWVAAFSSADLIKVPVDGGTPTTIAKIADRPNGGVWLDDGTIVMATNGGLYRLPAAGGTPELLVAPDRLKGQQLFLAPHALPGGRAVLFTIASGDAPRRFDVAVLDLQSKAVTPVLEHASAASYVSTGHLLFAAGSVLRAVAFDPTTLAVNGRAFDLEEIDAGIAPDNGVADYALSSSGTLVFISSTVQRAPLSLVWTDRNGTEQPLAVPAGPYFYPRISPNGKSVALDVRGNNRDIWILDLARLTQVRLSDGPTEDLFPVWSRDGRRVYFGSDRNGHFDVYSQPADGAAPATVEFAAPGVQMPAATVPGSSALVVYQDFRTNGVVDPTGLRQFVSLLGSTVEAKPAEISPDGKWMAYESDESGTGFDVYVRPFPDVTRQREKVSPAGGRYPLWNPAGSELYFVEPDGDFVAASISVSPIFRLDRLTTLFRWRVPAASGRQFDISPIDGRFLMTRPIAETGEGPTQVSVVLNWFQELRRRE